MAGFLFLCLPTPITAQRIIENWNFGWRFHRGEIDENQLASPDTSGWEVIDVPHDFQISQPWVKPDKSEKMVHLDGASFKTACRQGDLRRWAKDGMSRHISLLRN